MYPVTYDVSFLDIKTTGARPTTRNRPTVVMVHKHRTPCTTAILEHSKNLSLQPHHSPRGTLVTLVL